MWTFIPNINKIFAGPINETLGVLNIASVSFLKEETVYEILLELRFLLLLPLAVWTDELYCRKDTRNVTVTIMVEIIAAVPPIMEIECADPLLCLVGEGGKLFINPTSRLAVKAECSVRGNSDCSSLSV